MIEYDIRLIDGRSFTCSVQKDREPITEIQSAAWSDLSNNKCPNCPLNSKDSPSCPLALDVYEIAPAFEGISKETKVDCVVKTKERWYFKNTPFKKAFASFFNYVATTSSCPILRGSKWQRSFHIPFLSGKEEETFNFASGLLEHQKKEIIEDPKLTLENYQNTMKQKDIVKQHFLKRCLLAGKESSLIGEIAKHIEYVFSVKVKEENGPIEEPENEEAG